MLLSSASAIALLDPTELILVRCEAPLDRSPISISEESSTSNPTRS